MSSRPASITQKDVTRIARGLQAAGGLARVEYITDAKTGERRVIFVPGTPEALPVMLEPKTTPPPDDPNNKEPNEWDGAKW